MKIIIVHLNVDVESSLLINQQIWHIQLLQLYVYEY
jgi:hypothetical protein